MAKRSVRKARARAAQTAVREQRSDAHASSRVPSRSFWLGALASAVVLVPLSVAAFLAFGGGDEEPAAPAPSQSAAGSQVEAAAGAEDENDEAGGGIVSDPKELRKQFARRDRQQIEELTTWTRSIVDEFKPVVVGLGETLPPERERTGPLASRSDVEAWLRTVREADEYFAETPSGETATNVARNGFSNAVDVLLEAVETYKLALDEPSVRDALLQRARDQRDLAARTWSTASIQLDAINIEAGFGHQHVVFPSSAGPGALPPDNFPEGTDAEPSGDR